MIISVVSGKGGTGKTLVATSLAMSLAGEKAVQLLDCNVEEPDAHLFLKPSLTTKETVTIRVPRLEREKCNFCRKCGETCIRSAIIVYAKHILLFPELCYGCGACYHLCPQKALTQEEKIIGIVESGSSNGIDLVHGRLVSGETLALNIVKKIKEATNKNGTVIIDTPAGISRTVVQTFRGSDFCIIVTEPTPSGYDSLTKAVEILKRLSIPGGVILNRTGEDDNRGEEYCRKENIRILLSIPLDNNIADLYSRGITLVEGIPSWKESFQRLYKNITELSGERDSRHKR